MSNVTYGASSDFGTANVLFSTDKDGEYVPLEDLLDEKGYLPACVTYYAKAVVAEDAN